VAHGVGRLTAYGHSWVDGDGASGRAHTVAALVAAGLGLELDNRAVGGSGSTATAEVVRAGPPAAGGVVLVMTGLNDGRLHGPTPRALEAYADALRTILVTVREAVPDAVVVTVEQPRLVDYARHAPHDQGSHDVVDLLNETLRRVAAEHPGVLVVPVPGWDAATMLADDTVHPNDAGHAYLATAVLEAVRAAR
jgi:lysophospholipase L1-like esterase